MTSSKRKSKTYTKQFKEETVALVAEQAYRNQLNMYGMKNSICGKGNGYDNAVVEHFFGSLKYEWLANVVHLTGEGIINDVNQYIRYYNGTRLHSILGYVSPNEYENSQINLCN